VLVALPPAHHLQDGDDDVAGAASQAPDDPVAGVLLGRCGEGPAAMGAVVGHGSGVTAQKSSSGQYTGELDFGKGLRSGE